MIVVSDSSPLLNLNAVGQLHLLWDLYGEVVIPPAVRLELAAHNVPISLPWIRVVAARDRRAVLALELSLDPGESEAIILAGEIGAGLLLIDERRGRNVASGRGLHVTGLLGVLAEAKTRQMIPSCRPILDEMIRVAGLWIGSDLRRRYLRGLGEED